MADTSKRTPLVVLEESLLASMAVNSAFLAEFPVLAGITRASRSAGKPGCGKCGAAGQARTKSFQQVKQALAGMDAARKRRLKELLNAQNVRIVYRDAQGRAQQLTF